MENAESGAISEGAEQAIDRNLGRLQHATSLGGGIRANRSSHLGEELGGCLPTIEAS